MTQEERAPAFEPRVPGIDYGVLDGLIGFALRRAQLKLYEDFIRSMASWKRQLLALLGRMIER